MLEFIEYVDNEAVYISAEYVVAITLCEDDTCKIAMVDGYAYRVLGNPAMVAKKVAQEKVLQKVRR